MGIILSYVQFIYLAAGLVCFLMFLRENRWIFGLFLVLGAVGMVPHLWYLIDRGIKSGHPPFSNTFETLVLLSFLIMLGYVISLLRYRVSVLGGFAGVVAALCLAASSLVSSEIEPLLPALKSNWLIFHVVANFIAYASFALALGAGMVYLITQAKMKCGKKTPADHDTAQTQSFLSFLDWLTYRFIAFGFPLLTVGIATGAVWANLSWGRYWNWDPKETWAFVTWLIYAAVLHMRYVAQFRGRSTAMFAVAGFCFVMFTYFGVNYWLSSLHAAYA